VILIDHLVAAARTLEEGASWLESRLGVPMSPGGKHDTMGTHNRLLSLGPGRYIEVMAIDPEGRKPARPRWFALDTTAMQLRLARSPALIHWAGRTDDIAHSIEATAAGHCEVMPFARGAFRWRMGIPPSGSLAQDGTAPTMIQWDAGGHPSEILPDAGCRLESLVLHHPEAIATLHLLRQAGLDPAEPVEASASGRGLVAYIRSPRGIVAVGKPE
jgi:hypothetical protein